MASACAKIILFGEHFVAYNAPALVSTIDLTLSLTLKPTAQSNTTILLNNSLFQNKDSVTLAQFIFDSLSIKDSFEINIQSEIPVASGLGSSTAFIVALIRACNQQFTLNLNKEQINQLAFETEKQLTGIASGIDNTAIVYEGLIEFENKSFTKIALKNPLELLLVNTGVASHTKEMLALSRTFIQTNPQEFQTMVNQTKQIVEQAKTALQDNDLQKIGLLFTQQHKLLQQLGVSSPEIEEIISIAQQHHSYGAKLTGAGGGGYVIVCADKQTLQSLMQTYQDNNYKCNKVTIQR